MFLFICGLILPGEADINCQEVEREQCNNAGPWDGLEKHKDIPSF